MPAAFAHVLLLDEVVSRLTDDSIRQSVVDHESAACLGALGPDILFFYERDWRSRDFFMKLLEFYSQLSPVIDKYNAFRDRVDDFLNDATGQVWGEAKTAIETAMSAAKATIQSVITNRVDFFEIARPPMHDDYKEKKSWFWADLAHHCRTANLFKYLWNNTNNSPLLRAYALGHLTHIGGDVVGHAYVNRLVGGPYRHHWRRHVFLEKILDAQLWQDVTGSPAERSQLYRRFGFGSPDSTDPPVPDELMDYLYQAYSTVYAQDNLDTGVPSARAFKTMYFGWFKLLKYSSNCFLEPPERPPGQLSDLPADLVELARDVATDIPAPIGRDFPRSPRELKQAIRGFIDRTVRLCDKVLIYLRELIARLISLPVDAIRMAIWLLRCLVYQWFQAATFALALGGYIHPHRGHFDLGVARFLNTNEGSLFPGEDELQNLFPQRRPSLSTDAYASLLYREQVYHLLHPFRAATFPGGDLEQPPARPFYPNSMALSFRDALLSHDPDSRADLYYGTQNNPAVIRQLIDGGDYTRPSAADLTMALIDSNFEGMRNWNLDADRGLAWPQWTYQTGGWPTSEDEFDLTWFPS